MSRRTTRWPGFILVLLNLFLAVFASGIARAAEPELIKWRELPPIPDTVGRAGPFAGVSKDALIVGGGANFPEAMPWDGGKKLWYDSAFVLPQGESEWRSGFNLPKAVAYGVSITTPEGLLCIGGDNATEPFADVYLVTWNGEQLEAKPFPPLPNPNAYGAGVLLGRTVYAFGGTETQGATEASNKLLALNIDSPDAGWIELEPIPGPGRILPVAAALGNSIYAISGASLAPDENGKPVRTYLKDAYCYTPGSGWKRIADLPSAVVAAPTPAIGFGASNFFVIGGDDGSLVKFTPLSEHPGFNGRILSYHTITNTWANKGIAPVSAVTVPLVQWNGAHIIASGEVRPGVRSPRVWQGTPIVQEASFGIINYITLSGYLLLVLGVGVYCTRFNKNTNDYFRGGQRIPWWAAGLSIFATMLSSITFMALPARAYAEDWVYALVNLPILLLAPFIVYLILPIFRRIDATSAYEYLEKRFNLAARLFGAASFVFFQIGRMAVVLFLPSLAISAVTDLDITTSIVLMASLTVAYSVFGGITAVIWTDAVQAVILLGAAFLSFFLVLGHIDGGLAGFVSTAAHDGKFHLVNWTWDYTVPALWVVIVGNLFNNLFSYTADQGVVQRYMTTSDEKKAARSIWLNAIFSMVATAIFFLLGTALYVFYKSHPERLVPGFQNDAIFPLYIANELPLGIAGLVVAGIFAASQSTVSTSMNSVSTVLVTDFVGRLRSKPISGRQELILARSLTGILGVLGMIGALLIASSDVKSIWDLFLGLLGLVGSAVAGLFMLGIFTTRANGIGAVVGAIGGVLLLIWVRQNTSIHLMLYAVVGVSSCFIIGYILSLFSSAPSRASLAGLTAYTVGLRDQRAELSEAAVEGAVITAE